MVTHFFVLATDVLARDVSIELFAEPTLVLPGRLLIVIMCLPSLASSLKQMQRCGMFDPDEVETLIVYIG